MKYHAKKRFKIDCGGNAPRLRLDMLSRGPNPAAAIFTRRNNDATDMKPSVVPPQISRMKGTKHVFQYRGGIFPGRYHEP
jgi:hypothetical protein